MAPDQEELQPGDMALLTYAEAAAAAGVAASTIRDWVSRYGLRRLRLDGRNYLVEREVLDCEAERRRSARGRRRAEDELR